MYSHDTGLLAYQKWFQAVPSAYIHLHKYSVSPLHLHQQSWSKRSKCKLHLYLFVRTFLSLFFGFNCTFQHIFKLFLHQLWSVRPRSNTKCTLCTCVKWSITRFFPCINHATVQQVKCVQVFFLNDFWLIFHLAHVCDRFMCIAMSKSVCKMLMMVVFCWFIHSFIIRHLEMNTL